MLCPQCKTKLLKPIKLEPSLGALACESCGGTLLDLVAYRVWREVHTHEAETNLESVPEDSTKALLCPKCERIMSRFRYALESNHVIDVCAHCDHVWLQDEEWEFLSTHSPARDLPKIFTDPWQRRLRTERTKNVLEQDWDRRLGTDLHRSAKDIDAWLRDHPKRADFLDYLLAADPYET